MRRLIVLRLFCLIFWATMLCLSCGEETGVLTPVILLFGIVPTLIDLFKFLWLQYIQFYVH